MTASSLLLLCSLAVVAIMGLVALSIASARTWRVCHRRRTAALIRPLRPVLIELAGGDEPDPSLVRLLAGLRPASWRAIRPVILDLCAKLTDGSAEAVRAVLVERGEVRQALQNVTHRSARVRAQAVTVLELVPQPDSRKALLELLGDEDIDVRRMAARALGTIGDETAIPPLIAALAGRRPVPASTVGHCLIRLGPIAVEALVLTLRIHLSVSARVLAAQVLGHIGDPAAVPGLLAVLDRPLDLRYWPARVAAARALGEIGSLAGVPILIEGLGAPDPALIIACIEALAETGAVGAVADLSLLLHHREPSVTKAAANALSRLGVDGRLELCTVGATTPETAPFVAEALARAELSRPRVGTPAHVGC